MRTNAPFVILLMEMTLPHVAPARGWELQKDFKATVAKFMIAGLRVSKQMLQRHGGRSASDEPVIASESAV